MQPVSDAIDCFFWTLLVEKYIMPKLQNHPPNIFLIEDFDRSSKQHLEELAELLLICYEYAAFFVQDIWTI